MLTREALAIGDDTTAQLHDRLAVLGGRLVVDALHLAQAGRLRPQPQPAEGVSYAHKIEKAEAPIDWTLPAATIARRLRAFDPFPGATAQLGGETLKCWAGRAQPGGAGAAPGTVLGADATGLAVATGEGVLLLTELQRAGGKRLPAATLLAGFAVQPGQVLG